MEAKITKTIIANENQEFKINDDVHFNLNRKDKFYDCFGVIAEIGDEEFVIYKVQIDGMNVSDPLIIKYSEVKDGILHHTDNNWC